MEKYYISGNRLLEDFITEEYSLNLDAKYMPSQALVIYNKFMQKKYNSKTVMRITDNIFKKSIKDVF